MSTPIIELRGLRKRFNEGTAIESEVLHGIDLDVHRGEFACLIGPSGSGKSTLLNMIGLLDQPSGGQYRLKGVAIGQSDDDTRTRARLNTLGFVFQFHHLLPDFTAQENVVLPQLVAGASEADAAARAIELLTALGLGARLDHRPSQLSGGEQQRVAVARALANRPALVLADEPTGNLDEATSDRVFEEFLELVRGQNSAAIVATHNERLAARMDRVLRLHEGRVD